ncbi:MAG: glycosyltransferase family 4 protein [Acidobacteriota bacterium]
MRIAVDARELCGRPTGVGRYLAELLRVWAGGPVAVRHDWTLYASAAPVVPEAFASAVRVLPGAGGTRWEQWTLGRALGRERPDVLFAPGYTAPLTAPCPLALTVHDVSFAAHPEWFSWREGVRRRMLTTWSARRARIVLTDSAWSGDQIVRYLGIESRKVRVVWLGADHGQDPPPLAQGSEAASREPLILYVGSIFRRRHVDRLVSAFVEGVAHRIPNCRLEIVGEPRGHPRVDLASIVDACPAELAERVAVRSFVDDATLADLYARASVFAFPSEYEGFGLTPLEALAAGVPPVVLDTPVAREIYGEAACFVPADLTSHHHLSEALVRLLSSAEARHDVLRHAGAVLGRYDWRRTADATLQALEEAAGV